MSNIKDSVISYESIGKPAQFPAMHGAAVFHPLAIGKTVGAAPMAKLYYFAMSFSPDDLRNKKF